MAVGFSKLFMPTKSQARIDDENSNDEGVYVNDSRCSNQEPSLTGAQTAALFGASRFRRNGPSLHQLHQLHHHQMNHHHAASLNHAATLHAAFLHRAPLSCASVSGTARQHHGQPPFVSTLAEHVDTDAAKQPASRALMKLDTRSIFIIVPATCPTHRRDTLVHSTTYHILHTRSIAHDHSSHVDPRTARNSEQRSVGVESDEFLLQEGEKHPDTLTSMIT
ncbi:hypothetical protein EK21DRAFT_89550 [Setomelanomma holmii]|uniref:Uncharacterized protein n=1 Tax=Setomelanomma holmii TaxID=210430 RepID=A0A9P4LNC4_9PLEO|nr:hypothetical protein EK21DRAFT_89550 [Setomelanomma holmii]